MNDITTVLALVNGMVGGVLLLLPQLAKKAGYILIVPIIIVIGFLSYFSSVLCLRHLCNYRDIDESMYYHFGQRIRYKYFYDIVIILSLTLLLLIYFKLICNQWVGLFSQTPLIPLLNGLGILIFIFWIGKRSKEGIFFSIGIFSIFGYCVFLIWSISTAPKGQNQM